MKKYYLILGIALLSTNSQGQLLDKIKSKVEEATGTKTPGSNSSSSSNVDLSNLSSSDISSALKDALNIGVEEGIGKLGKEDGFYKNSLVKILMPEELRKVETTLRSIGLGSLADEGVKLFNRAAEDAVTESLPIFANAITSMTFDDAKNILLDNDNAATNYLKNKTSVQLYTAFEPKVEASLGKVGADKVWENLISKYNTFTGKNITTDLNQYVTQETLNGVFKMVAEKEEGIRNNPVLRTTSVLNKVFGALD